MEKWLAPLAPLAAPLALGGFGGVPGPPHRQKWLAPFLLALLALVLPAAAAAQPPAPAAPLQCPAGDLLRTARVSGDVDRARLPQLSDGVLVREGMPWPGPEDLVVFRGPLTFDLGQPYPLRHLRIQSDADQGVRLELSVDEKDWTGLTLDPSRSATGMLRRSATLSGAMARWVRVSATDPTGVLALTELSVYCEKPAAGTAIVAVVDERPKPFQPGALSDAWQSLTGEPLVSPQQSAVIRLLLALTTALGALGFVLLSRRAKGSAETRLRLRKAADRGLVGLALIAALSYFNFGAYRYPAFAHQHEFFHYFVGSRYFPELGYTNLYDCAMVAQAEAGFPQRVGMMSLRDLRTNRFVEAKDVLANAAHCRKGVSDERWRQFTEDVRYFFNGASVSDTMQLVRDHGFNATPLWIAIGNAVSEPFAANDSTIGRRDSMTSSLLPFLDPLLLLASALAMGWAFGFRAACLAVIVFAVDPLTHFAWIGGAYLRQAWLFVLVLGFALLRKRRWDAAGVVLALAAHLLVFPGLALVGIAAMGLMQWRAHRKVDRSIVRVLRAAAVTGALVGYLVVPWTGRPDCWQRFFANIEKHASTPSKNLVGLPAALSFAWSARAEVTANKDALDIYAETRRYRVERLAKMRPLHVALSVLGVAGMLAIVRRKRPLFWAAGLGMSLSLLFVSVSCYYLSWLVVLVPIAVLSYHRLAWLLGGMVSLSVLVLALGESDTFYVVASAFLIVCLAGFFARSLPRKRDRVPRETQP